MIRSSGHPIIRSSNMDAAVPFPAFSEAMEALRPFPDRPRLAAAVSGGADSMALALLAQEWAQERGGALTALTVDHRLRQEAAAEAEQVAEWLRRHGIAHHVLTWDEELPLPPGEGGATAPGESQTIRTLSNLSPSPRPSPGGRGSSNLQARAREARYRLLTDWCISHGVRDLLLAHHLDDQAETFLLRLARGSGVDGLACMRAASERDGLRLLRPLLGMRKRELTEYLERRGQSWIEDPSNRDPAYARTHARRWLGRMESGGILPAATMAVTLAATAGRMGRARAALEHYAGDALARHARIYEEGCAVLDPLALRALPEETALRLLSHLLCAIGGRRKRHRLHQLEPLFEAIKTGEEFPPRTFGGCLLIPRGGRLWILREPAACAAPAALIPGREMRWDNRFTLYLADTIAPDIAVGPLAAAGWHALRQEAEGMAAPGVPGEIFHTLPALFRLEKPVAVPHLNWYGDAAVRGRAAIRFRPLKSLPGERYHVLMSGS